MSEAADLPNDVEALKRLILERTAALEAKNAALESAKATLISQTLELERLRFEIACLKRMKYGRSSEQLDQQLTQIQLTLEDLESSLAQKPEAHRPVPKEPPQKPVRQPLPEHLPREEVVHETPCVCPECGGTRLRAEARAVRVALKSITEVCKLTVKEARAFFSTLQLSEAQLKIADKILEEIRTRLQFLDEVGLDLEFHGSGRWSHDGEAGTR